MSLYQLDVTRFTATACEGMHRTGVSRAEIVDSARQASVRRTTSGRLDVVGSTGIRFITDATGTVVIAVLPSERATPTCVADSAGVSRHRPLRSARRRPQPRTDQRRPA